MRPITTLLIAVLMLACAQPADAQIKRTNPSTLSAPTGYTHVVEAPRTARTVYIAGQVALDRSGQVVGKGDMKAQAEQVFKNLEAALAAAGASFKDVVKSNTFVTDISQAQAIRDVRAKYFGNAPPANTLVQVVALARPELMLEIEVIAAVGQ